MITAVSRIFVALMGRGYDAGYPYVEFRETQAGGVITQSAWGAVIE